MDNDTFRSFSSVQQRIAALEYQKKQSIKTNTVLAKEEEEEDKFEWAFDIKHSQTDEDGNTWTSISDTRGIWSSSAQPTAEQPEAVETRETSENATRGDETNSAFTDKSSGVRTDSVVLPESNCTITIFSEDSPALRVSMDGSINKVSLKEERSIEFRDSADEETSTLYLHDTFSESQGAQKRSPSREEDGTDVGRAEMDNDTDDRDDTLWQGLGNDDKSEDSESSGDSVDDETLFSEDTSTAWKSQVTPETQKTMQEEIEPDEFRSVGDCDTFETLEEETLEEATLEDDIQSVGETDTFTTMEDESSLMGWSTPHVLPKVEQQKKTVMGQLQQLTENLFMGGAFDYVLDRAEEAVGFSEYLDEDGNIPKEDEDRWESMVIKTNMNADLGLHVVQEDDGLVIATIEEESNLAVLGYVRPGMRVSKINGMPCPKTPEAMYEMMQIKIEAVDDDPELPFPDIKTVVFDVNEPLLNLHLHKLNDSPFIFLSKVEENSRQSAAGFKEGMCITRINDQACPESFLDMVKMMTVTVETSAREIKKESKKPRRKMGFKFALRANDEESTAENKLAPITEEEQKVEEGKKFHVERPKSNGLIEKSVGDPEPCESSLETSSVVTTESRGPRILKFLKRKKLKFSRRKTKKASN